MLQKKAISDGYEGLKALLKERFGNGSNVMAAVEQLESKPDSAGRQQVVAEELSGTDAAADAELLGAAATLLDQIKREPGGTHHIQIAQGRNIAQADRGSTATVNVTGWQGGKDEGKNDV